MYGHIKMIWNSCFLIVKIEKWFTCVFFVDKSCFLYTLYLVCAHCFSQLLLILEKCLLIVYIKRCSTI